jgi:hypothetical protein
VCEQPVDQQAAPREPQGSQADATEAVGDRIGRKRREITEGQYAQALERVDAGRLSHCRGLV